MKQGVDKPSFKFENLRIWQDSMSLAEDIFKISQEFPKDEIYNLTSQVRRASDSVALNTSEGSILQSDLEYRRFLVYSIRSLAETVTCFHKARRREYVDGEFFSSLYKKCFDLMNMTVAFRNKIGSK